jgi:tetratricopeptide (TPR) repeat protein
LTAFRKAAAIDPNYADAYFWTGEMLMRKKNASEAVAQYEKALSLKPNNNIDALVGLGQAYYQNGDYAKSIEKLTAAAKLKNDNWETFASLADAYRSNGDFNLAIGNYNNATLFLTRQPNFNKETAADLYGKAGYSIALQCPINMAKAVDCHWLSAVTNMQKAVDLSGSPIDYANLGWAYYNAARSGLGPKDKVPDQAKLLLAKDALLKAIGGGNPIVAEGAYQNLGGVQIDLGDPAGAIDSLNRVVDKHPDWTFSRYALGTAYFKTNDFNNALTWFQRVVDAEPNYVPALTSLGYTQIKLKNGGEARKMIDRLKRLDPAEALKVENSLKLARL